MLAHVAHIRRMKSRVEKQRAIILLDTNYNKKKNLPYSQNDVHTPNVLRLDVYAKEQQKKSQSGFPYPQPVRKTIILFMTKILTEIPPNFQHTLEKNHAHNTKSSIATPK